MLECLFGYKIGALFIHHIPKDNPLAHKKIFLPYMRSEVIEMMQFYRVCNPYRKEIKKIITSAPQLIIS